MAPCFLKALDRENSDKIPVWIMRQAGRYLPEYQRLRQSHSLKTLFTQSDLIEDVTLMPLRRFDLDAAIVFSDILLPLEVLGGNVDYIDGVGPVIKDLSLDKITQFDLGSTQTEHLMSYLKQGIKRLKKNLNQPLIGFVGGPLTTLSYVLDHAKKRAGLHQTKKCLYQNPLAFHSALKSITKVLTDVAKLQVEAGVDAFQVFETCSFEFSGDLLQSYSMPYIQMILDQVNVPSIVFAKGVGQHIDLFNQLTAKAIGVDYGMTLQEGFSKLNRCYAIQGQFDPAILLTDPKTIEEHVSKVLTSDVDYSRFIANLGHGILPSTPLENVQAFVETIHQHAFSPAY